MTSSNGTIGSTDIDGGTRKTTTRLKLSSLRFASETDKDMVVLANTRLAHNFHKACTYSWKAPQFSIETTILSTSFNVSNLVETEGFFFDRLGRSWAKFGGRCLYMFICNTIQTMRQSSI